MPIDKYFTSPLKKTNHCNKCKQPIKEKDGRFSVEVQHDIYIKGVRHIDLYGYKTFCSKCFYKRFEDFKDAQSIYKMED